MEIKKISQKELKENLVFHINNINNIWFKIEKKDPSRWIYIKIYKMNMWYDKVLSIIEFDDWKTVLDISDAALLFATENQIKEKIMYIMGELEKQKEENITNKINSIRWYQYIFWDDIQQALLQDQEEERFFSPLRSIED